MAALAGFAATDLAVVVFRDFDDVDMSLYFQSHLKQNSHKLTKNWQWIWPFFQGEAKLLKIRGEKHPNLLIPNGRSPNLLFLCRLI